MVIVLVVAVEKSLAKEINVTKLNFYQKWLENRYIKLIRNIY